MVLRFNFSLTYKALFVALGLFHFLYPIVPLGVLYPEHSQLTFDCVVIACSLESIKPSLFQDCNAPNSVS